MKKKAIIISIIVIGVFGIFAAGIFAITRNLSSMMDIELNGIDISSLNDGVYTGTFEQGRFSNTLTVQIENHIIIGINIDRDVLMAREDIFEDVLKKVIKTQNTNIDAISGATVTTNAYLMAIEDALNNDKKINKRLKGNEMKALIVYSSRYGCTADCADLLKKKLPGDITLIDINKATKQIDVIAYDTIIIGSSVYVGRVSKNLRTFYENNHDTLIKKNLGIFLCSAQVEQFNETLKLNFPASLLESAKSVKLFGSEARLEKMKFFDKLIIKAVTKGDFSSFKILYERIDEFAGEMAG